MSANLSHFFNSIKDRLLTLFKKEEETIDLSPESLTDLLYEVEQFEGETIREYSIIEPNSNVPYAKVKIKRLPTNELLYELIQPLNPLQKDEYDDFKKYVFYEVSKYTTNVDKNVLWGAFLKVVSKKYKNLSKKELGALWFNILNDCLKAGKITPLFEDPNIEDITCSGYNLPVYIYHKDYTYIKTNIAFSEEELDEFITTLCNKQGVDVTLSNPIVDLVIYDKSRVNITFKNIISDRGTTFTIRRLKEKPYTPIYLIKQGTICLDVIAYASLAIDLNASIMVIGATASGKTTTLNALALLIPPSAKIVSIEDTREIQLPHENWTPMVTRGNIDAFQLVITSLRQRPDYIIVGEARGKEVEALFQAMATGHPCLTTMHAGTVKEIIRRLTSPAMGIQESIIPLLNIVITMDNIGTKEQPIRKNTAVHFILDHGEPDERVLGNIYTKRLLKFDYNTLKPIFDEKTALECLSEATERSYNTLKKMLEIRKEFLKQCIEYNKIDMDDFHQALREFKTQITMEGIAYE